MINDIENMPIIPPGYVGNKIRTKVKSISAGSSLKFGPSDYAGIPARHFHNTLMSVMGSEYGYNNIRTLMDQKSGIVEGVRLR